MGISELTDSAISSISFAVTIIFVICSITLLFIYSWVTDNELSKMMIDHHYQECAVYIPNTGNVLHLWQKECQVIEMYSYIPPKKR